MPFLFFCFLFFLCVFFCVFLFLFLFVCLFFFVIARRYSSVRLPLFPTGSGYERIGGNNAMC